MTTPRLLRTQITSLAFLDVNFNGYTLLCVGEGPLLRLFRIRQPNETRAASNVENERKVLATFEAFPEPHNNVIHGIRPLLSANGQTSVEILVLGGRCLRILSFDASSGLLSASSPVLRVTDWIFDTVWLEEDGQSQIAVLTAHNRFFVLRRDDFSEVSSVQSESAVLTCGRLFGSTVEGLKIACGTSINGILIWEPSGNIISRLEGHAGAVYCVTWSEDGNSLASFGEDRTVRVWTNLSFLKPTSSVLYGHTDPVWRGTFLSDSRLCSVGEDAVLRIWDFRLGKCLAALSGHMKPDIWSVVVNSQCSMIATGGSDSAVVVWNLADVDREDPSNVPAVVVSLPPAETYIESKPLSSVRADAIRSFALLDAPRIVVSTSTGYFLLSDTATSSWSTLYFDPAFSGNTRIVAASGFVFAASYAGHVVVLSTDGTASEILQVQLAGAVAGIQTSSTASGVDVFVYTNRGEAAWIRAGESDGVWKLHHLTTLDPPKDRTAFPLTFAVRKELVLIGTAAGRLLVYAATALGEVSVGRLPVAGLFENVHGGEMITCVKARGDEIWTSGKDGALRKSVLELGDNMDKELEHSLTLTDSSGTYFMRESSPHIHAPGRIERFLCPDVQEDPDRVLILGFVDAGFYILDKATEATLITEQTGNAQRQCEMGLFQEPGTSDGAQLVLGCLKSGNVVLRKRSFDWKSGKATNVQLQEPLHAMKINCVAAIGDKVFATGSEDGLIKLLRSDAADKLDQKATLACGDPVKSLTLCGTWLVAAGGRGLLMAWRIDSGTPILGHRVPADPIGFRIMEVSSAALSDGSWLIFAGQSDGKVMLWHLSDQAGFEKGFESNEHGKCLLRCRLVSVASRFFGLSASTDGKVYVWNFGNGQGPFAALSAAKFDLHQNGVNGLDVSIQGPLVFLATGGDDGMVAVSLVDLSDDDLKLIWTRREFASGSTVRAVRFLDSGRVVSVGTDQVVKVWDFTGDGNTDLRLVAEQRTSIADIGDLELMSMEGKAMAVIVGQGLEMSIVINDLTQ